MVPRAGNASSIPTGSNVKWENAFRGERLSHGEGVSVIHIEHHNRRAPDRGPPD